MPRPLWRDGDQVAQADFDSMREDREKLSSKVKELEATIGCLGIGTDADECAAKWMVAAQSMADDRDRYRKALEEALDPLDLYNAYGWQDRNGVRAKIRALINPAKLPA